MILSLLLASALASDPVGKARYTNGGIEHEDVWSTQTLVEVARLGEGVSGFSFRCGTLNSVRTCAAHNAQGAEVARTTQVSIDDPNKWTLAFGAATAAFPYTRVVVQ